MKKILIIGYVFYALGVLKIIDWFIFCNRDNNFKSLEFGDLKVKYISRFPEFIKPLFTSKPELAAVISFIILSIAGVIFIKSKNRIHLVLGASAFIFALWNLFSIM